jgi:hypothetical protein
MPSKRRRRGKRKTPIKFEQRQRKALMSKEA